MKTNFLSEQKGKKVIYHAQIVKSFIALTRNISILKNRYKEKMQTIAKWKIYEDEYAILKEIVNDLENLYKNE